MTTIFYGTPEEFFKHKPLIVPVYISGVTMQTGEWTHYRVFLTAHNEKEVHMCMIEAGTSWHITPEENKRLLETSEKIREILRDIAQEFGVTQLIDGMVAFPKDVHMLDAWSDKLKEAYD